MCLLALSLVRLIRPLHVPSLANCSQLRPAAITTAPSPVRPRRLAPAPGTRQPGGCHPGSAAVYQASSAAVNRVQYRPFRSPAYPPAASVHSLLWILWTTTPSSAFVTSSPAAPVSAALTPTAPSEPSKPRLPLLISLAPHRPQSVRATSPAITSSSRLPASPKPTIQDLLPAPLARRETTFPIFNRKPGLCGCWLPRFRTFSPPVDSSVDKPAALPANLSSLPSERQPLPPIAQAKPLHFAHPYSHPACGKSMFA